MSEDFSLQGLADCFYQAEDELYYYRMRNEKSMGGSDIFYAIEAGPGYWVHENAGTVINTGCDDFLMGYYHHGTEAYMLVQTSCGDMGNNSFRLVQLNEPKDCLAGVEDDSLRDAYYRQQLLELCNTGMPLTDSMLARPVEEKTVQPEASADTASRDTQLYTIQIAAIKGRQLTEGQLKKVYKGKMDIIEFREGVYYKYRIGQYKSIEEADKDLEGCGVHDAFIRPMPKVFSER